MLFYVYSIISFYVYSIRVVIVVANFNILDCIGSVQQYLILNHYSLRHQRHLRLAGIGSYIFNMCFLIAT